ISFTASSRLANVISHPRSHVEVSRQSPLTDGAQHILVRSPNKPRDAALSHLQHQLRLPLGVLVRVPFSLRVLDLDRHVSEVLVIGPAVEWLVCEWHPVTAELH